MATKTITVEQIAIMIKIDFLYEFGKLVINETGVELLPDTPANEKLNRHLVRSAAAAALDHLGVPINAFDHIFKNMMLADLCELNKEAAKEAMLEGDVEGMMTRLMNAHSLSEILEN